MRILYLGDVVGKTGRIAIQEHLPTMIEEMALDFVIVNGENSAHGFGINRAIADDILNAGADVITLGDHAFDNAEVLNWIDDEPRIVRPDNIGEGSRGRGVIMVESQKGHRVLVSQILGTVFMKKAYDSPWDSLDKNIQGGTPMDNGLDAIIVDIHAEATSEKQGVGHYLDGRASLVVGTHTHIPTSDTRILEHGTGYQTDAGMCGCYDSMIGMEKHGALNKLLGVGERKRFSPATGEATLSGVLVETDENTGLAKSIHPVKVGGFLQQAYPTKQS